MAIDKNTYEELDYYDKVLSNYISVLYTNGLELGDYYEIEKIRVFLSKMKSRVFYDWSEYVRKNKYLLGEDKSFNSFKLEYISTRDRKRDFLNQTDELLGEYTKLCDLLRKSVVPKTLKSVLNEEGSILHLVLANEKNKSKITPLSMGNFMFFCQFHAEKHASMQVNDYKRFVRCYGCGIQMNLIDYFMNIEKLSYQEAVNLLAKIYMIKMKNEIYKDDHPLVIKYRTTLLDAEYRRLLDLNLEKTKNKEISWEVNDAIGKLEHDKELVSRIESNNHIVYWGKKPDKKKLVLEMPLFERN